MIGRSCKFDTGFEPPDKQMWNVPSRRRPVILVCGSAISVTICGKIRASLAPPYQEGRPRFVGGKTTETPCGYATKTRGTPLATKRRRDPVSLGSGSLGVELVLKKLAPRREI
jgi:hypothetical protein